MSVTTLKNHKTFNGVTRFHEHESSVTKTKMKFSSFTPAGDKPKGCLIWLSGLTCTDENFITKAGAQKYFAAENLMVICPDTSPRGLHLPAEHDGWDFGSGASFYVDATTEGYKDHYKMESYITEELFNIIQNEFGIKADKISISGHSMGGHGALILGLRHPQKFKSVSAFSPIVHPTACAWGKKAFTGYLGTDESTWKTVDATELVKSGKKHANKILIDQGTSDEFWKNQLMTDDFDKACREGGQAAEIRYQEGYDHSYYFISTFIESHIQFHSKAL